METGSISLYELNTKVRDAIKGSLPLSYWVTGEIAELRTNRSGHCYLELVEKSRTDDRIIARARANIWMNTFRMLKPYFETTTGRPLTSGIGVMVNVTVEFHELYGFSLNIKDINPTYTLGDLAKKKKEILARLEAEGVIDMNRELDIPALPQRIAVISSKTAAGYGDFCDQLTRNPYDYAFYFKLFEAVMQGDQAESSIIRALEKINYHTGFFDVVVLIRGGGAQADLNCFDNYRLAYNIAQFPIPVISGIGHERDDTIVDRVAHTGVKTPTAAAEFLINRLSAAEAAVDELYDEFTGQVREILARREDVLERIKIRFSSVVTSLIDSGKNGLLIYRQQAINAGKNYLQTRKRELYQETTKISHAVDQSFLSRKQSITLFSSILKKAAGHFTERKKHFLDLHQMEATHLNPDNILKRGYSISLFNGKALKNPDSLCDGDIVKTLLSDGAFHSEVRK
ncbi:MAG: exodeoxyribonuclease VII large subunit [Bacteroidetes bacterium]|nr:exodeoxyribonuclease VII large subunit [Bacteroidota bacterium]